MTAPLPARETPIFVILTTEHIWSEPAPTKDVLGSDPYGSPLTGVSPARLDAWAWADSELLLSYVEDNERQGLTKGIGERDLAVCFEMDAHTGWGLRYTASRFRRALKALAASDAAVKVDGRWFTLSSKAGTRAELAGQPMTAEPANVPAVARVCVGSAGQPGIAVRDAGNATSAPGHRNDGPGEPKRESRTPSEPGR